MPNSKNYWCVESSDGKNWVVKQEGNPSVLASYTTQAPAWTDTKNRARASKGEAFLKDRNGHIRERESYGNDPYPPPG
jgi:hypothetical protein